MHKDGVNNKKQLNIIKIIFTSFTIKEMCLWDPWELPVELGSAEHSLNTTGLRKCTDSM
jgi:hypothetical protein